jgi:hypothetical protein
VTQGGPNDRAGAPVIARQAQGQVCTPRSGVCNNLLPELRAVSLHKVHRHARCLPHVCGASHYHHQRAQQARRKVSTSVAIVSITDQSNLLLQSRSAARDVRQAPQQGRGDQLLHVRLGCLRRLRDDWPQWPQVARHRQRCRRCLWLAPEVDGQGEQRFGLDQQRS